MLAAQTIRRVNPHCSAPSAETCPATPTWIARLIDLFVSAAFAKLVAEVTGNAAAACVV